MTAASPRFTMGNMVIKNRYGSSIAKHFYVGIWPPTRKTHVDLNVYKWPIKLTTSISQIEALVLQRCVFILTNWMVTMEKPPRKESLYSCSSLAYHSIHILLIANERQRDSDFNLKYLAPHSLFIAKHLPFFSVAALPINAHYYHHLVTPGIFKLNYGYLWAFIDW